VADAGQTTEGDVPMSAYKSLRDKTNDVRKVEDWITDEFLMRGAITADADQRDMDHLLRDVSNGRNAVIFDDDGNPSIMVRVPSMILGDLYDSWESNDIHPAFIVDGSAISEFWIGKYQAHKIGTDGTTDSRAMSLRRMDPANDIDWDDSFTACEQNGDGWHLMTNAEWSAIALWCYANGYWPRGNNSYGRDYSRTSERGEASRYDEDGRPNRIATGTGPNAWSHDGTPYGIFDLNGNVWEWVSGLRIDDGEIQIIENNDAAENPDQSDTSTEWQAILEDGSLVSPGTADTLKYDASDGDGSGDAVLNTTVTNQSDGSTYTSNDYDATTAESGVTVPDLLSQLALYPHDDNLYVRNVDEHLPRRGGSWYYTSHAGVFALSLNDTRSITSSAFGFRPAYFR